jgi:hypothetical protein
VGQIPERITIWALLRDEASKGLRHLEHQEERTGRAARRMGDDHRKGAKGMDEAEASGTRLWTKSPSCRCSAP